MAGTAHLIHGYLGAGKTTYARKLAVEAGGVCIDLDEWYLRIYTDGTSTAHQDPDLLARLWAQLDDHWPQLLAAGVNVVLDFGFWSRESRDRARSLVAGVHGTCQLHWVRTDDATAISRCLARNEDPGASFLIDASAYAALRSGYEPARADEEPLVVAT